MEYDGNDSTSKVEVMQITRLQCQEEGCAKILSGLRPAKETGLRGPGMLDLSPVGVVLS